MNLSFLISVINIFLCAYVAFMILYIPSIVSSIIIQGQNPALPTELSVLPMGRLKLTLLPLDPGPWTPPPIWIYFQFVTVLTEPLNNSNTVKQLLCSHLFKCKFFFSVWFKFGFLTFNQTWRMSYLKFSIVKHQENNAKRWLVCMEWDLRPDLSQSDRFFLSINGFDLNIHWVTLPSSPPQVSASYWCTCLSSLSCIFFLRVWLSCPLVSTVLLV